MRLILWPIGLVILAGLAAGVYMFRMPGQSHTGALPALTPDEAETSRRLAQHVLRLAGAIGERHLWRHEALDAAAQYVQDTLRGLDYEVTIQPFEVRGATVKNLAAELHGTTHAEEIVVVGAHYDSVPGSPGANDNASGVAAVLELARRLAAHPLGRTVRFVAFVNEEAPFYHTDGMGSWVYARQARARGERIVAMLSVETIGYYSDVPGSQQYPFPFGWFYPDVGNFIGFVGNLASRGLVRRSIAAFRDHTAFPSQGTAAPGGLTGIGWSDHWAFWQAGYDAIMITDTALFRYPHYHTPYDTPDRLDYDRMGRVVVGLEQVARTLAAAATP